MRGAAESRALGWLAVAAVAVVVWLALPFAVGLLLGTLTAFIVEPLYRRLVRQTKRPAMSAAVCVIGTGIVVLAATFGFITLFITHLSGFIGTVRDALQPGGPLSASSNAATAWLGQHGIDLASASSKLENGVGEIASRSAAVAAAAAAGTFSLLLSLFFALLAMYVTLRYWPQMTAALEKISPLDPSHSREVLEEFRRAGRATLSGTVVTGLAQGVLAGIGYWMSGVPQPAFFGAATAVASLIPGVGTLLIWVPAGLFLFFTGHVGRAVLELVWCSATVIGLSDYVIRPALVGDEDTPAILTFIALFGGLEVFGISGLIVGPIVMSIAVATLRLYTRETGRTHQLSPAPHKHAS
jgi:predicted PurR-regulated permease PerM